MDSEPATKRIYRQFAKTFGVWRFIRAERRNLFLDKDNLIPVGDFRAQIQLFIIQSDHMLVVIGPKWLEEIKRRQRVGEVDFVVIEVELAFIHKVNVIPVLVQGASMPERSDLPDAIKQLAPQQAYRVRDDYFEEDINRLISLTKPARSYWMLTTILAIIIFAFAGFGILDGIGQTPQVPTTQAPSNTVRPLTGQEQLATVNAQRTQLSLTEQAYNSTATVQRVQDETATAQQNQFNASETAAITTLEFLSATPTDTATNTATPTNTPTATDTPIPTDTPTNTPDPLLIAIEQAENFTGSQNSDWTPYEQEFDGVEMVLVPVGCFLMGSWNGDSDERPVEEQCIEEPFWIDKYEVTQGDLARLGGEQANPSSFSGDNRPVENITWFDAQAFCESREGSLPTELQWEYAARGIDSLTYPWGNLWNNNYAVWGRDNSQGTANVGSITFGSTGISWVGTLDMIGNVREWTSSLYRSYPYGIDDGREDKDTIANRVVRGDSWNNTDISFRYAANRTWVDPNASSNTLGFRCVRPVD